MYEMKEYKKALLAVASTVVAALVIAAGAWCFNINAQVTSGVQVFKVVAANLEKSNERMEKVVTSHENTLAGLKADNEIHKRYNDQIETNKDDITSLKIRVGINKSNIDSIEPKQ